MSADLSAFFAKKNDKKKKVVKMDDVGQILERRAKKQEEHERELEEDEKRNGTEDEKIQGEDSDWLDYDTTNAAGKLDGLNIKDMGAESEHSEVEHNDVAEQKEQHETRTWGQLDKKEDKDVQTAAEMAAYQQAQAKPSVFIPSFRREQNRPEHNIDVTNQEMFPSLADASKIEIAKKEDKTFTSTAAGGGWQNVKSGTSENRPITRIGWGAPPPATGANSSSKDKAAAIEALKALNQSQAPSSTPAPAQVRPVAAEPEVKKPGAYVPPHLRNRNYSGEPDYYSYFPISIRR